MKKIKLFSLGLILSTLMFTSCVKDLDVKPIDPNVLTADKIFEDYGNYRASLAKVYSCFNGIGLSGDAADADIQGIDGNFSNYLRQFWGLQELSTDEAIIAWDDATIKNFHYHTWTPSDIFNSTMYARIMFTVSVCNDVVRNFTATLSKLDATKQAEVKRFIAEARFVRAFVWSHAIDMYGNPSFVDETNLPGLFSPKRIERKDLFDYVVKELNAIDADLADPGANEYGRVDKAAAWMLLSNLYLNAKVYTGEGKFNECITTVKKVIASKYTIDPSYKRMFSADNDKSSELIWSIPYDAVVNKTYGGMVFLIHASIGGGMPTNGVGGGWGGIRSINDFVSKFGLTEAKAKDVAVGGENESFSFPKIADKRGMFFFNPKEWSWNISNVGTFTEGIGVNKFRNVNSDGTPAVNVHPDFVCTDFPIYRLADAYLIYAEAVVRGGTGGDKATALSYVNALRDRAYGNQTGRIAEADLTLPFLLDERARELYWEGHRRTDLIRFEQFTQGVWSWKGKVQAGIKTDAFRALYPIPSAELISNPNLVQNTGY